MAEFKVIIAEDEKLIRNGIRDSIDWKSLGAETAGLAKNGKEAITLIQENNPDILLTDIKMASGNGLELIKNAKVYNPEIKVIIISGYNNFEYAQQAIQLGVKDYILKPIDIEKLQQIIANLIEEIKKERENLRDIHKLENFYQENRQILIDEFFRELLFGAITGDELEVKQKVHGFKKKNYNYFPLILYTEIKDPIEWASLKSKLTSTVTTAIEGLGLVIESLFLMPNDIFYTDITLVLSMENISFSPGRLLPSVKTAVEKLPEVNLLAMGIGELCNELTGLSFSYQKAKTHALYSMISGLNSKNNAFERSSVTLPLNIYETTKTLQSIFTDRDSKKLKNFFAPIEIEINNSETDITNKRTMLRNLFVCVLSAGDELGIPVREFFPDLMALFRYINLKSLQELLTKIKWACEMIISQQQTRDDKTGIDLMEKAKSFIKENYTDPLISLETVSAYLTLTPAYFSRLYKQAHGVSYIETLTRLRLERAVDYLKNNPDMKISAISANVGYNTPSYFNYIFKKHYGCSPREFQENPAAPN